MVAHNGGEPENTPVEFAAAYNFFCFDFCLCILIPITWNKWVANPDVWVFEPVAVYRNRRAVKEKRLG